MLQLMATASVSDMNRHVRDVLSMLEDGPVAFLQGNEPAAVMISPVEWNEIGAELEELENLRDIIAAYQAEIAIWEGHEQSTEINLAHLKARLIEVRTNQADAWIPGANKSQGTCRYVDGRWKHTKRLTLS